MYCLIPLAGPEINDEVDVPKPLQPLGDATLFEYMMGSRGWNQREEIGQYIFVLRQTRHVPSLMEFLRARYPDCKIVINSDLSRGALLSAMAGVSQITEFDRPLIIDLIDIRYQLDVDIARMFAQNANLGGLLPVFASDEMKYSYAHISDAGKVIATKEKCGFDFDGSNPQTGMASAGTYIFRDVTMFLNAAAENLQNPARYAYKNNLFICPAMNGVVSTGRDVYPLYVTDVESYS